jgi:transcriptional regulator with XRE-family HTH domain
MTQEEFAETLGISKQHLSHIENGRKVVSPERAARWASLLGYAESQFVRLALQDADSPSRTSIHRYRRRGDHDAE